MFNPNPKTLSHMYENKNMTIDALIALKIKEHVLLQLFPKHEQIPHLLQKNTITITHIESNTPNKRTGINILLLICFFCITIKCTQIV
jgi:hypothetical protein